jgi:hypothetical protein
MGFNYDPNDASSTWDKGVYAASLEAVDETISKNSGEAMQVLTFRCWHSDGREQLIKEYIVRKTLWKLKAFAKAIGKLPDFIAAKFQAEDHINASLNVELRVDAAKDGFEEKNSIAKMLPSGIDLNAEEKKPPAKSKTPDNVHQDDIPF